MKLSGWGRYPEIDCQVVHLHQPEELLKLLDRRTSLIARGNGRSYGDAALNPQLTLSMLEMDRILEFDTGTGILTCEAGMLLSSILEICVPQGWFPPVVPGTKFVTVGGMIAADVHGKNHHLEGTFGAHLESFTLVSADGELRVCSREENTDLFRATIGGMGLTGVILSASFRLKPIETAYVMAETFATSDLDETMTLFDESHEWTYTVAWIDCLARGKKLGRALLSRGMTAHSRLLPEKLSSDPLSTAPLQRLSVPANFPSVIFNSFSIGLFNNVYYRKGRMDSGARISHYDSFFFPLDRINAWNGLYGTRGFVQYQCVLPEIKSSNGIATLLEYVTITKPHSPLAVLKPFGKGGDGLMSFPMKGYTLAMDFPMGPGTLDLVNEIDSLTHKLGGRVYLAKDACTTPERLREGYPDLDTFIDIRAEATRVPDKFASCLSQRLEL